MAIDNVRAAAHRSRVLSADAVKHTQKTVGVAATTHVLDARCTQVRIVNVTDTGALFIRFDAAADTTITADNGFPLSSGDVFDVKGGETLQLIADLAGQDCRILETLLA